MASTGHNPNAWLPVKTTTHEKKKEITPYQEETVRISARSERNPQTGHEEAP